MSHRNEECIKDNSVEEVFEIFRKNVLKHNNQLYIKRVDRKNS